jgi:hypothetical protein
MQIDRRRARAAIESKGQRPFVRGRAFKRIGRVENLGVAVAVLAEQIERARRRYVSERLVAHGDGAFGD